MKSRDILTICILFFLAPVLLAEEPVVLAVASVADKTRGSGQNGLIIRPLIVTRLVRDYNCVVLSRSASSALITESNVKRLKAVADPNQKGGVIWAADHAIKLSMEDKGVKGIVAVVAEMKDLRRDEEIEPMSVTMDVSLVDSRKTPQGQQARKKNSDRDYAWMADQIAAKIAYTLELKKREPKKETAGDAARGELTWAVLPIARPATGKRPASVLSRRLKLREIDLRYTREAYLGTTALSSRKAGLPAEKTQKEVEKKMLKRRNALKELKELESSSDSVPAAVQAESGLSSDALTTAFELALQESLPAAKMVDRAALADVFRELQIGTMIGASENLAGRIARLAGADRLILGSMSKRPDGSFVQNTHLIDAKTSVVLSACEISGLNEEALGKLAATAVHQLISQSASPPTLKPSPKWRRHREAWFYHFFQQTLGSQRWLLAVLAQPAYKAACLERLEASALLMHDDPKFIMEEIVPCVGVIVDKIKPMYGRCGPISPEVSCRGVELMDALIQGCPGVEDHGQPFLRRATAHLSVLDFRGALLMADEHLKRSPDAEKDLANYLRAEALYGLRDYERAVSICKEIIEKSQTADRSPPADLPHMRKIGSYRQKVLYLLSAIGEDPDVEDEELELYAYDKGRDREARYMMLTRKHRGIDAAIKLRPSMLDNHRTTISSHDYLLAEYLVEAGRRDDATTLCNRLIKEGSMAAEGAKKLLSQMDQSWQDDVDSVVLKKGADICPFPKEYKIYCFPVEGSASNRVHRQAKAVGEWFGTEVVIQKPLPLPAGTFMEDHNEFFNFSRQLLQNAAIPEDAALVYFVTGAPLAKLNVNIVPRGGWWHNPSLFSYNTVVNGGRWSQFVIGGFVESLLCPPADPQRPAPFRRSKTCELPTARPGQLKCSQWTALCPSCSARYKNGFAACHKVLQAFAKRKQKMLVPSNAWFDPACYIQSDIPWQDKEAVKRIRSLAAKGDVRAQYSEAFMLMHGLGIVGNEKKAAEMFKSCAPGIRALGAKGGAEAMTSLGLLFEEGWGVPQDHKNALKCYRMASDSGDAKGAWAAGRMLYRGYGTPKDLKGAQQLWEKAESKGYAQASYALGSMFKEAKDYRGAYASYKKAAEAGSCCGMSGLAECYYRGWGVERDAAEADKWALRGVKMSCPLCVRSYARRHGAML